MSDLLNVGANCCGCCKGCNRKIKELQVKLDFGGTPIERTIAVDKSLKEAGCFIPIRLGDTSLSKQVWRPASPGGACVATYTTFSSVRITITCADTEFTASSAIFTRVGGEESNPLKCAHSPFATTAKYSKLEDAHEWYWFDERYRDAAFADWEYKDTGIILSFKPLFDFLSPLQVGDPYYVFTCSTVPSTVEAVADYIKADFLAGVDFDDYPELEDIEITIEILPIDEAYEEFQAVEETYAYDTIVSSAIVRVTRKRSLKVYGILLDIVNSLDTIGYNSDNVIICLDIHYSLRLEEFGTDTGFVPYSGWTYTNSRSSLAFSGPAIGGGAFNQPTALYRGGTHCCEEDSWTFFTTPPLITTPSFTGARENQTLFNIDIDCFPTVVASSTGSCNPGGLTLSPDSRVFTSTAGPKLMPTISAKIIWDEASKCDGCSCPGLVPVVDDTSEEQPVATAARPIIREVKLEIGSFELSLDSQAVEDFEENIAIAENTWPPADQSARLMTANTSTAAHIDSSKRLFWGQSGGSTIDDDSPNCNALGIEPARSFLEYEKSLINPNWIACSWKRWAQTLNISATETYSGSVGGGATGTSSSTLSQTGAMVFHEMLFLSRPKVSLATSYPGDYTALGHKRLQIQLTVTFNTGTFRLARYEGIRRSTGTTTRTFTPLGGSPTTTTGTWLQGTELDCAYRTLSAETILRNRLTGITELNIFVGTQTVSLSTSWLDVLVFADLYKEFSLGNATIDTHSSGPTASLSIPTTYPSGVGSYVDCGRNISLWPIHAPTSGDAFSGYVYDPLFYFRYAVPTTTVPVKVTLIDPDA